VQCSHLLLCLYAVALNEPTTVSEICNYIERSQASIDSVDYEEIEKAVEVLSTNDLLRVKIDPYRAYVISLDASAGGSHNT
jgi:hypothetical protein